MEYDLKIDMVKDLGVEKIKKQYIRFWLVRCNLCGTEYKARAANIKTRNRCVCVDCAPKLHYKYEGGKQNHPLHVTWELIKRRVDNTSNKKQSNDALYNGINICKEWLDFSTFVEWAETNGYKKGLTIDRIDPYGDYSPNNCRWTDLSTQAANKKISSKNSSGYTGISYSGRPKTPFKASIRWKGKEVQKRFTTLKEALEFRNNYIIEHKLPHPIQKYKEEHENIFAHKSKNS